MNIGFNFGATHVLLLLGVLWWFDVVTFNINKVVNHNNVCIKGYSYVINDGDAKPIMKDGKYVVCDKK